MIWDSWVSWEKGLNTTFLAPKSKFDGLFHDLQKSGKTLAIPCLKGWPFSPSSNREFWKLSLAVCGTWTATFMKEETLKPLIQLLILLQRYRMVQTSTALTYSKNSLRNVPRWTPTYLKWSSFEIGRKPFCKFHFNDIHVQSEHPHFLQHHEKKVFTNQNLAKHGKP